MAYCPNCGADVPGDAEACASCGISFEGDDGWDTQRTAEGSTSRRTLLTYAAVGAAVLGGGAGAYTLLGRSEPEGPAGTVRAYVRAIGNENEQRAIRLVDDESRLEGDGFAGPPSSFRNEMSVEEATVVEEAGETAAVRTVITWQVASRTQTLRLTFELRTREGDWRIYNIVATRARESGS